MSAHNLKSGSDHTAEEDKPGLGDYAHIRSAAAPSGDRDNFGTSQQRPAGLCSVGFVYQ